MKSREAKGRKGQKSNRLRENGGWMGAEMQGKREGEEFNEETMILGGSLGVGGGLIFDLSDPSVRVTGLSTEGGLR